MALPDPGGRAPRAARLRRALAVLQAHRRRLERRVERRFPGLYDARHAATGIGRALWPLIGPVLAALIVVPVLALLAALVALLGLHPELPSVDLPSVPLPAIEVPGWLRAVGEILGDVLSVVGPILRYGGLAAIVLIGLRRTREVRRRRAEAEQTGRAELARRLATALTALERRAGETGAATLGELSRGA